MIAICNHCRAAVAPEAPIIGQNLSEVMRLYAAMQTHLLNSHPEKATETYMAGMNAHSLFIGAQFRCNDPEFRRIASESLAMLSKMIEAFKAAIAQPPAAAPVVMAKR